MKQRYRELTHKICVQAVMECYDGKWHRHDFVDVAGKYGGVTNAEIKRDEAQGAVNSKLEAAEGIALEMEQRLLDLMEGEAEDLDLDPVVERPPLRRTPSSGQNQTFGLPCDWMGCENERSKTK